MVDRLAHHTWLIIRLVRNIRSPVGFGIVFGHSPGTVDCQLDRAGSAWLQVGYRWLESLGDRAQTFLVLS